MRYEYMVVQGSIWQPKIRERINELGAEGWRVMDMHNGIVLERTETSREHASRLEFEHQQMYTSWPGGELKEEYRNSAK